MGTSLGVKKSWANLTTEAKALRLQNISKSLIGEASERVKKDWDSMSPEDRKHKLRGLLNLTPEQRKEQAKKGGQTRKGRPAYNKGIARTPAEILAITEGIKKSLAKETPEHKAQRQKNQALAMKGKYHFQNHPEVARQCGLDFWTDPEKARRIAWKRPTKPEKALDKMLSDNFPGHWKYVGHGEVRFGGKCPDFININGKKQLIELFGIHWHEVFDVSKRIDHFRKFGFSTMVIWEDELKNQDSLLKKIKSFTRR